MKAYESIKIGQNRGSPRLWLEGMKASMAGFLPGKRFSIRKDEQRNMLVLELSEQGSRLVSRKVKGDQEIPVIDINSMEVLSIFEGFDSVRVIVQKVRIVILPTSTDIAKQAGKRGPHPGGLFVARWRGSFPCNARRFARSGGECEVGFC